MANNTISSDLLLKNVADALVAIKPAILAPLSAFTTLASTEPLGPMRPTLVNNVTSVPAVQMNIVNWEANAESVIAALELTPVHLSEIVQISSEDAQSGIMVAALIASAMDALGQKILDVPLALLTEANYAGPLAVGSAAFGESDVATLREAVRSPGRALLLDTAYFNKVAGLLSWTGKAWSMPGFENVFEIGVFTAAGSGISGACMDRSGIIVLAGVPLMPAPTAMATRNVTLPGVDLQMQANTWCQPQSRFGFVSLEIVIGAAVAKTSSVKLIKGT